jgi:hypothetical protein
MQEILKDYNILRCLVCGKLYITRDYPITDFEALPFKNPLLIICPLHLVQYNDNR